MSIYEQQQRLGQVSKADANHSKGAQKNRGAPVHLIAGLAFTSPSSQQQTGAHAAPAAEGKGMLHVFASTWNMGGGIERDELLLLERLGLLGRWIPRDPAYDLYVRACVPASVCVYG